MESGSILHGVLWVKSSNPFGVPQKNIKLNALYWLWSRALGNGQWGCPWLIYDPWAHYQWQIWKLCLLWVTMKLLSAAHQRLPQCKFSKPFSLGEGLGLASGRRLGVRNIWISQVWWMSSMVGVGAPWSVLSPFDPTLYLVSGLLYTRTSFSWRNWRKIIGSET